MRSLVRRSTAALLMAAAVVVAAVVPSYADDYIGLSMDGQHWSTSLSHPLFAPRVRWVPGDVGTRSFWVRNQGASDARMRICVASGDADGLLADRDIRLRARVDGGSWVPLRNGVANRELSSAAIPEEGRRRVDVQVVFAPSSRNQSQRSRLRLRFVVTLSQAVGGVTTHHDSPGSASAGIGPADAGHSGHSADSRLAGILPGTGSSVTVGLVWAAAALIGSGVAILLARRKNDESRQHVQG